MFPGKLKNIIYDVCELGYGTNTIFWQYSIKQAGAELDQAQLPTGIWLHCDLIVLAYINQY